MLAHHSSHPPSKRSPISALAAFFSAQTRPRAIANGDTRRATSSDSSCPGGAPARALAPQALELRAVVGLQHPLPEQPSSWLYLIPRPRHPRPNAPTQENSNTDAQVRGWTLFCQVAIPRGAGIGGMWSVSQTTHPKCWTPLI